MPANIQRTLGKAILEASSHFKVVLLTGPRQVGMSRLLWGRDEADKQRSKVVAI